MKTYKKPDGSVWAYEEDGSQDNLITEDMLLLSEEEVSALHSPVIDPKIAILAEIDRLERDAMLPRLSREFMLGVSEASYPPEALAMNNGYVKLKEFNELIATLRSQL